MVAVITYMEEIFKLHKLLKIDCNRGQVYYFITMVVCPPKGFLNFRLSTVYSSKCSLVGIFKMFFKGFGLLLFGRAQHIGL